MGRLRIGGGELAFSPLEEIQDPISHRFPCR